MSMNKGTLGGADTPQGDAVWLPEVLLWGQGECKEEFRQEEQGIGRGSSGQPCSGSPFLGCQPGHREAEERERDTC